MKEVIKDVDIDSIIPYDNNYLNHDNNWIFIRNSIRDFGYNKVSIGIDENNVMLYGHGTLRALKDLNYGKVPMVMKISDLDEKQKHAYRISDNSSAKDAEIIQDNLDYELEMIDYDFDMTEYGLEIEETKNNNHEDHWEDMPEFENENKEYYKTLIVHFLKEQDVQDFSRLINQNITEKTKYINFPYKERDSVKNYAYVTKE